MSVGTDPSAELQPFGEEWNKEFPALLLVEFQRLGNHVEVIHNVLSDVLGRLNDVIKNWWGSTGTPAVEIDDITAPELRTWLDKSGDRYGMTACDPDIKLTLDLLDIRDRIRNLVQEPVQQKGA